MRICETLPAISKEFITSSESGTLVSRIPVTGIFPSYTRELVSGTWERMSNVFANKTKYLDCRSGPYKSNINTFGIKNGNA